MLKHSFRLIPFVAVSLLFQSVSVWAAGLVWNAVEIQTHNGQRQVVLKGPGQPDTILGTLDTIPAHRPMYHWAPVVDAKRWLGQGHVDSGELNFLMQGSGARGGGYYASVDSLDSSNYGPWVSVLDSSEDLNVLNVTSSTVGATDELNQLLCRNGIDGVYVNSNWINFITLRSVEHIRKPTLAEITQNPRFASQAVPIILRLDSEIGVDPAQAAQLNPTFEKLVNGTLDESTIVLIGPTFGELRAQVQGYDTALSRKYIAQATALLGSKFAQAPAPWQNIAERLSNANDPLVTWIQFAENAGIQPSEFLPDSGISPIDYAARAAGTPTLQNPFASKLKTALEFIDTEDMLVAAARQNGSPWTLYDEAGKAPLIDRWTQASNQRQALLASNRTQDRLVQIHRILQADSDAYYRNRAVLAGGDIYVGSKGYYSLNAHQKTVLENNPFLSAEIIDDPWHQGAFLARHEYPSASTYKKFKSYLSQDLASKLDAADAAHQLTPDSPQFQEYTQKIIEELTVKAYQINDPVTQYLMLMSVHPFNDFNGRSLRMLYKTETNMPLYVWDYDMDILMSPTEFRLEIDAGRSSLSRLAQGLAREATEHPGFPRFYDVPELWMLGSRINPPVSNPARYVDEMKHFYSRPDIVDRIRHKQFQEVYSDLTHCDACLARNLGG